LAAVDASDSGDAVQARELLRRSKKVHSDLQSQEILDKYLSAVEEKLDDNSLESLAGPNDSSDREADYDRGSRDAERSEDIEQEPETEKRNDEESSSGISAWFLIPLLIALAMLGFFGFAFRKFLKEKPSAGRYAGDKEYSIDEFEDEAPPAGAEDWDSEEEEDFLDEY